MCSAELARKLVGGEELGPLRAMTAIGARLSLYIYNILGVCLFGRHPPWG
jgi:hypothetical protein